MAQKEQSRYNSSMQTTTTTVTSKSASSISGTIGQAPRKTKTKRPTNYVVMVEDEPENAFATAGILSAAKHVRALRKEGYNVDEISVTKNGNELGWASFASMASVARRARKTIAA